MESTTTTAVRDIMSSGIEPLARETSIEEAANKLSENHVAALPVCDAEGRLQGVVTDGDIAACLFERPYT